PRASSVVHTHNIIVCQHNCQSIYGDCADVARAFQGLSLLVFRASFHPAIVLAPELKRGQIGSRRGEAGEGAYEIWNFYVSHRVFDAGRPPRGRSRRARLRIAMAARTYAHSGCAPHSLSGGWGIA